MLGEDTFSWVNPNFMKIYHHYRFPTHLAWTINLCGLKEPKMQVLISIVNDLML